MRGSIVKSIRAWASSSSFAGTPAGMLKNSAGGGTDQRRAGWFHTILAGVRVYQRQPDARTFDKSRWGLSYTAGLSLELATLLQTSAWEAAQDYFGE